ncbi:hypothetical protein HMPREF1129_1875 [Actinomyces naeslundii str. Howell 279]|uniref:Uncharacterized protein n=1 Tax=Actinomyces naeslundii (strain ATCC 12104 / DSM 43013 / CCUG 2238 / JCM 8349 / NCTC 10301 / Howell 279) TaxID=1115803 RepID=J3JJ15_ACTNH|nr:hypothetical protein HMPREF1129_1875 [Actinomyces naeslundii str. Howell 279]
MAVASCCDPELVAGMAAGIQRGRPDGRGARAAPGRAVSYNAVGLSTCGREACAVGEKAVMAGIADGGAALALAIPNMRGLT